MHFGNLFSKTFSCFTVKEETFSDASVEELVNYESESHNLISNFGVFRSIQKSFALYYLL